MDAININASNVTEVGSLVFTIEASEAGIAPGNFPQVLTVDGLGNGQPFRIARWDPERRWYDYKQELGCITLRVFND